MGVITLSDIMITVMGDWVTPMEEEQQIIKRDNHSWFIDGSTPIEDVKHALAIEEFPENENYETIAGFIMYRLRKIPRPADAVEYAGFKFEVVDIDHYKIDQLLCDSNHAEFRNRVTHTGKLILINRKAHLDGLFFTLQ